MTRMTRRRMLHLAIVPSLALAAVGLLPAFASADPCPPLDPACVVEPAPGTAIPTSGTDPTGVDPTGAVEDAGEAAGGAVEDAGGTVGGTVGGPLGEAIEQTAGTVGGILSGEGPIGLPIPDSGGQSSGTTDVGTVPSDGTTEAGSGGAQPSAGDASGQGPGRATASDVAAVSGGPSDSTPSDLKPSGALVAVRSPSILAGVVPLVRTIAFPVALILMVAGFVLMQGRIDRKDPKLALAPVGSDYLVFR